MAAVACLLVVLSLFDSMAQIRSSDTDRTVREFLASAPGQSLGLDVESVVRMLRALVLLSGALAAAGLILSVYSLRRHRGARVGLTVVAVLMLFSATFVAGLLPLVVVLGAGMLWRREARDWFDGRAPQPRATEGAASPFDQPATTPVRGSEPGAPPPPAEGQQSARPPRPFAGTYGRPPAPYGQPQWRPQWRPQPTYGASAPARRPAAVTAAAWLTWVFGGITAVVFGLLVLSLLVERGRLLEQLQRNPGLADQGLTSQQWLAILWVAGAVGIFWSLAAMALAVLAYNRVRAGQVGLVVSAALSAVLCTVSLVGLLSGLAGFATVVLLLGRGANRWFTREAPPEPRYDARPERQQPPPSGKPPVW
ncbi:MAG: hypothetical protein QOF53_2464 [Nocardioidaceae bacterium]|nr:hypothetical protein [Nocardioidaceae bacterium]